MLYTTGLMSSPESGAESGHIKPEHPKPCVFCEIVAGRAPAGIIQRSKKAWVLTAREDGYPLIVTTKHIQDILDSNFDTVTAKELGRLQREVARLVCRVDGVDSVTIAMNSGRAAGQVVPHLHVHVMPRTRGDRKVRMMEGTRLPLEELVQRAERYRAAIGQLA